MSQTPCSDRTNDPNDWFIRPDGKQYTDEDFLTETERRGVALSVIPIGGETHEEHEDRVKRAINAARSNRRRAALARRRAAKSLCRQCPIMIECMTAALDRGETHGTWGGLLEEELAEVRREQARRRRRKGFVAEPTLLT